MTETISTMDTAYVTEGKTLEEEVDGVVTPLRRYIENNGKGIDKELSLNYEKIRKWYELVEPVLKEPNTALVDESKLRTILLGQLTMYSSEEREKLIRLREFLISGGLAIKDESNIARQQNCIVQIIRAHLTYKRHYVANKGLQSLNNDNGGQK